MTVYLNTMMNQSELQQRLHKLKKNFDLRDCIGLSSLIFGLILSNSAIEKNQELSMHASGSKAESHHEGSKKKKARKKRKHKKKTGVNRSKHSTQSKVSSL